MRLWTIRTVKALESDRKTGFIWNGVEVEVSWWTAYHWIAKQMRERLKVPVRRMIAFPVWAWVKKPDLRRERHHWQSDNLVLIEFEMPENELLLSDFDTWHYVLNDYPILNQKEDRKFERELKKAKLYFRAFEQLPWKYRIRIEKSWEKVFDIKKNSVVQATMWEIPLENIKKIVYFKTVLKNETKMAH